MQFQKSSPAMTGVLQTDDKDPKSRRTMGEIALWLNESENGKAPKFRGILETEKGKFRISLWDKEEKGEESPSIFYQNEADFICRYCHCILADSDVLWDACNRCASVKEGLRV
jgi:hypothetical protein